MKPIRYTKHALNRIKKRNISVKIVEQVIREPEQIVPDLDDINREIYQSIYIDHNDKTKLLRVVIEEKHAEFVIVTVYPTSQIERYREK